MSKINWRTKNQIQVAEMKYLGRTRGVIMMDKIRKDYIFKECATNFLQNKTRMLMMKIQMHNVMTNYWGTK